MENTLSHDLDHILQHTEGLWQDLRGERVFLTGGTGFVGTWLLESLLWANRRLDLGVRCTVLTRDAAAFERRAPHLAYDRAVMTLAGHATSFDFPDGTFSCVIHAATEKPFAASPDRPYSTFRADVDATTRVLEFVSRCHAHRMLFTSSGAVYGPQPASILHVSENYPGAPSATDVRTAYGQAKRASEFLCCSASQAQGFGVAMARLFTFVGPHLPLDVHYAVGNFLRDVLEGGPIRVAGDGTPYRSYLYAADLAAWLWTMLLRAPSGVPFNVGSSQEISIADLACRVVESVSPETEVHIAGTSVPGAPASRYVPDTRRAAQVLGLQSWIPLEEGIRRTYDWHVRQRAMEESCV
ncbi:MAG: NAD-dependent epimerase/dehydratase family protein [Ignavibacteriota bacterium]